MGRTNASPCRNLRRQRAQETPWNGWTASFFGSAWMERRFHANQENYQHVHATCAAGLMSWREDWKSTKACTLFPPRARPIATCFVSMADRRIEPFAPRYRYHIEEWIDISVRFRSIPSPPDGLGQRPSLWFFQSKPGSTRVERGRNRVQPEIEGNETEGVDRHERRTCARQAWSATRRPHARRPWCRKTPGRCRRSCSRWWVP